MTVEWLEYDLSEAAVTRGLLWWKRRAIVQLAHDGNGTQWRYANSGTACESWLASLLFRASSFESERRRYEEDWQPVRVRRKTLPMVSGQRVLPARTT